MDSVFRTKQEPVETVAQPEPIKPANEQVANLDVKVEPPFTSYQDVNHKPYTADYFKLGPYWEDKAGGFKNEIDTIESYITGQINTGQIDNSLEAVKEFYKKVEKISGSEKTERTVIKIAKMAAYVKFLKDIDSIKLYGHR